MAWLGRIARNLAIDHLRRASLRARHERADTPGAVDDEGRSAVEHSADPAPGPLDHLEVRRLGERARVLLADLSPAQQRVILLTFWDDLSQTEIAECLGLPVGTVKSSIRRGLMAMRDALERQEARQLREVASRRALAPAARGPAGVRWVGLLMTAPA